jgi:hypothetical protein
MRKKLKRRNLGLATANHANHANVRASDVAADSLPSVAPQRRVRRRT